MASTDHLDSSTPGVHTVDPGKKRSRKGKCYMEPSSKRVAYVAYGKHEPVCVPDDAILGMEENTDDATTGSATLAGILKMGFPKQLNLLLSKKHACVEQCSPTSFRIVDEEQFVQVVLPNFFKTAKMASFKRQLNMYSFTRVEKGPMKDAFTHDGFVIGDWNHIATHVFRKKKSKNPEAPEIPRPKLIEIEGGYETSFRADCAVPLYANETLVGCWNKLVTTRDLLEEIRPKIQSPRAELETRLAHIVDPFGVISQTPLSKIRSTKAELSMEPSSKRVVRGKLEPLIVPDDATLGPTPSTPTIEPVKRSDSFNVDMGALDHDSFSFIFGEAASNGSQRLNMGRASSIGDLDELLKIERANSLAMKRQNSLYSPGLDSEGHLLIMGADDIGDEESTDFASMWPRSSSFFSEGAYFASRRPPYL